MRRTDKFLISKRPYAIDPSTLWSRNTGTRWHVRVNAVWFRRKAGGLGAYIGTLWDIQEEEPRTALEMVERHVDGRYGGDTQGRWNGSSYWGTGTLDDQVAHLKILRPMLAGFPEIPPGFDGWWTF
jgi:hypothetical protein